MSEFKNVTVVKKANIYFGGQVVSYSVLFADGTKKTLGVMQAGEYEFSTGVAEIMEILSGELEWQLKGESEWQKVVGGEAFNVPAHSIFLMKVPVVADYCCSYAS
ncbi:MAG: pyrimidine/purine nucleoside phosphorylase [Desulfuromonadaceae bacterium]|nr:pyrimidine/purine nucleoside phosphorylase [Desulfuromonadaceae bacterium]